MAGVAPPPCVGDKIAAEERQRVTRLDHQFAAGRRQIIGAPREPGGGRRIVVCDGEIEIDTAACDAQRLRKTERRMVAGLYSNRVRQGMMLQADPTIIYPITKGKPLGRRIRQSEIAAVNDYNTYSMVGLPKGPITNPGRASIEAVLNPAKTDALYMVADGKGGHVFASTLEEHNANVARWFAIRRARGEM